MELTSTSLLQVYVTEGNMAVIVEDAVFDPGAMEPLSSILKPFQSEIIIFLLAGMAQVMLSGRRRKGHARRSKAGGACSAEVSKLPEPIELARSGAQDISKVPQPVPNPTTLVEELRCQLQGAMAAEPNQAVARLLEKGPVTVDLLVATRQILSERSIRPEGVLAESLLREYIAHRLFEGFDELLAEVEWSQAVEELVVKAAVKRPDLEGALRGLEGLFTAGRAVAQCLIQQVARLAAQNAALPRLLPILRGQRLSCETLNVLLSESVQCSDTASFEAAEQLGRKASVHFNTMTYCILLGSARSDEDANRLLSEAALGEHATRGVLEKAAELAAERGSLMIASAVLKHLPSCRRKLAQGHVGTAAALLRVPVASALRQGRDVREADQAVLDFYEQHVDGLDLSGHPQAQQIVVDAAVRRNRMALPSKMLEATASHSQRVALLQGLCSTSRFGDALRIVKACPSAGPNVYNALLEACVACHDMNAAETVVQEAVRVGGADVVTYNTLIMARLQTGDLELARNALGEMRSAGLRPNSVTFNELLDATVKMDTANVWEVLDDMRGCGIVPNMITCSILLKCVQQSSRHAELERILAIIADLGDDMDEVLLSSVVEACIRAERTDLLEPQLRKHWGSWRNVIQNSHTYGSIIRAYGVMHDLRGIWCTWRDMRRRHIMPTSITLGCMIEALVTSGELEAGYDLVQDMFNDKRTRTLVNSVIYCSLLKGFARKKDLHRTWRLYEDMLEKHIKISLVTYNVLVDACARCCEMGYVTKLLGCMMENGVEPNLITYSTIVKGYCRWNKLDKAFEVLESMRRTTRFEPDEIMFNSLLDGCARKGSFELGMKILADMEAAGIPPSNFTLSLLVKMAGRGRHLDRAFSFCMELPRRYKFRANVHVYDNLVLACISMRALPRALSVLAQMVRSGVQPDTRTYTLLLGAFAAGKDSEVRDAAGLLRVAMGLKDVHPASLADVPLAALRPSDGLLPTATVMDVLAVIASRNERIAMELARDLEQSCGFELQHSALRKPRGAPQSPGNAKVRDEFPISPSDGRHRRLLRAGGM